MAPKGLPKPLFDKIYTSLEKMMREPATRDMFMKQGADPMFSTPQEMVEMIESEYVRFGQAIKLAGLTIQ